MRRFHESISRSLAKTATFRILILALDFAIVYFFTRKLDITLGVLAASHLSSSAVYLAHERAWNHIRWGRGRKGRKAR